MYIKIGYTYSTSIKGVYHMRPKTLNFEQLVKKNKQELLEDEHSITRIEKKLESKQIELVEKKRDKKVSL